MVALLVEASPVTAQPPMVAPLVTVRRRLTGGWPTCAALLLLLLTFVNVEVSAAHVNVYSDHSQYVSTVTGFHPKFDQIFHIDGLFFGQTRHLDKFRLDQFMPVMFEWFLNSTEVTEVENLNSKYVLYQRSALTPPISMRYDVKRKVLQTTVQFYERLSRSDSLFMCGKKLIASEHAIPTGNTSFISSVVTPVNNCDKVIVGPAPSQGHRFKAMVIFGTSKHEKNNIKDVRLHGVGGASLILLHKSMDIETMQLRKYELWQGPDDRVDSLNAIDDEHQWYIYRYGPANCIYKKIIMSSVQRGPRIVTRESLAQPLLKLQSTGQIDLSNNYGVQLPRLQLPTRPSPLPTRQFPLGQVSNSYGLQSPIGQLSNGYARRSDKYQPHKLRMRPPGLLSPFALPYHAPPQKELSQQELSQQEQPQQEQRVNQYSLFGQPYGLTPLLKQVLPNRALLQQKLTQQNQQRKLVQPDGFLSPLEHMLPYHAPPGQELLRQSMEPLSLYSLFGQPDGITMPSQQEPRNQVQRDGFASLLEQVLPQHPPS
eukprot:Lankesteria_metandrocarpae@DN5372_c0_g1_i2.p1